MALHIQTTRLFVSSLLILLNPLIHTSLSIHLKSSVSYSHYSVSYTYTHTYPIKCRHTSLGLILKMKRKRRWRYTLKRSPTVLGTLVRPTPTHLSAYWSVGEGDLYEYRYANAWFSTLELTSRHVHVSRKQHLQPITHLSSMSSVNSI